MEVPLFPSGETARLIALRATGLLDSGREERFDRITRTAARLFNVPIVLVSLVDECRQWFKSKVGLEASETHRDISFCGHAILQEDVFVVEDARSDPRFADNPLVLGPPHIRFYAGCPLLSPKGERLGTLCLISPEPRIFNAADRDALQDLAAWASLEVNAVVLEATLAAAREGERFFFNSLDLLHVAGFDGRFKKVNQAYTRLLGWSEEELLAMRIKELVHPDDLAITKEGTKLLRKGETLLDFKHRLLHKDGSYRWVAWKTFAEGDQVFGFGRDMTSRLEAEEALREAQNQYRLMVELTPDIIARHDRAGRYLFVSPSMQTILGYRPEELIGVGPIDHIHPSDQAQLTSLHQRLLRGESTGAFRYRAVAKDGREVWLEARGNPVRSESGRINEVVYTSRDVNSDQLAQATQAKLMEIFERSPDIVSMFSPDSKLLYMNPSMRLLLGFSQGENLQEGNVWEAHAPWSARQLRDVAMPTAMAEGIWGGESAYLDTEGREVAISQIILAHKNVGGGVAFLSSVGRDISERKRLERELHQLLKASPVVLYRCELESPHGLTYISANVEDLFGYRPMDCLADPNFLESHIHRDDLASLMPFPLPTEGGRVRRTYRFEGKGGAYRWVLDEWRLRADPSGKFQDYVGSMTDVTEQVERQIRIEALISALPDIVFLQDRDGVYLEVHASRPNDLFHPKEDILGRPMSEFVPRDVAETRVAAIREVLKTREPKILEFHLERNGRVGEFEARIVPCGTDQVLTILRDISARKTAEENLRQSEIRFRAMLNAIPDEMFRMRGDGTYLDVHASRPGALWYPPEDFIGHTLHELLPAQVADARLEAIQRALEKGEIQVLEYQLTRNGGTDDFEARTMPAGAGEAITIVRNVTEQKALERLKAEFIATISHELRTPLTSIRGSLALLRGGALGELPEAMKDLLAIAENNALRLVRLVNDILDQDKAHSGLLSFTTRPASLPLLLREAAASLEGYARTLGVEFRVEDGPAEAMVQTDPDRLFQVLVNLLSNAGKFAPSGSAVRVRWMRCPLGWRVEVEDHGSGIPPEFLGRIFQKYAQAYDPDSRAKGGSGLGLNLSKALMEAMGGKIGFESSPGRTVFHLELSEAATAPLHEGRETRLPMVLHVEDDRDVHRILSLVLHGTAELIHAPTLYAARTSLQMGRPDLVILDSHLPDGLGVALLPDLKACEGGPVPVLLFSGEDPGEEISASVARVLVKSDTATQTILEAVASIIRETRHPS